MGQKKVCIYVRVSTQDKQTTERQSYELKKELLKDGFEEEDIEVFSEVISGFTKLEDRPILSGLIMSIKNDPKLYDTLCIHEISRLGRDPITTRTIIDELTTLGVNINIHNLKLNTITNGERNWVTNILLTILMEYSKLETDTFKERSKSGLLKSARMGRMGGGIYHTYGYRKDDNKMMVIDDEESEVIKKIFNLYLMGNGIKVISNILNEEGIPTRLSKSFPDKIFKFGIEKHGKDIKWSDKQIWDILKNPTYIGKREFSETMVGSPQIIDEITFNTCNELLVSKNVKGSNEYTYILKELIKCGFCGRNYYGRYKKGIKGEKVYKCSSTRYKGQSCGNLGININYLDSVLVHFTNIIISLINQINTSSDTINSLQQEIERIKTVLVSTKYEIKNIINKNHRLLVLYEDSILEKDEYVNRKDSNITVINKKEVLVKKLNKDLKQLERDLTKNSEVEFLDQTVSRKTLNLKLSNIYDLILIMDSNKNNIQMKVLVPLLGGKLNRLECEIIIFPKDIIKKNKEYHYRVNTMILNFNGKTHFIIEDLHDMGYIETKSEDKVLYSKQEINSINKKLTNKTSTGEMKRLEEIISRFTTSKTFDFHKGLIIDESLIFNIDSNNSTANSLETPDITDTNYDVE